MSHDEESKDDFNNEDIKNIVQANIVPKDDTLEFVEVEELLPGVDRHEVSRTIHEASQVTKSDSIAVEKANAVFAQIFQELNVKYNLNVSINMESFADTLSTLTDPSNKRTIELYISEAFSSFRLGVYLKLMQSISILSEKILDPKELLSDETSYSDKFIIVEKLFQYMAQLEEIYSKVKIKDSDMKLDKIQQSQGGIDTKDDKVVNFLEELKNSIEKKK